MKLGVMQPYFFPYIGYFQLIHAVDRFFLYDNADYSNGSWINRNRILLVHGQPFFVSVPIKKRRSTTTIRNVELVDGDRWRNKLLRSIHSNYRPAPCFHDVYPLIEEILFHDTQSLAELNKYCISRICDFLDIETEILVDSRPFDDLENRLRDKSGDLSESFPDIRVEKPARKVIRLIEVCRALHADILINALGGQEIYNKEDFAAHDIDLLFVSTRSHEYPQRSSTFYSSLSIIDVLMNCGRSRCQSLLTEYDLL